MSGIRKCLREKATPLMVMARPPAQFPETRRATLLAGGVADSAALRLERARVKRLAQPWARLRDDHSFSLFLRFR